MPVPEVVPPGVRVNVHVPDEGNPLSCTDPVDNAQVGWVMVPTVGAAGATGCAFITTLEDAAEVHPDALVTVKVYVPEAARPLIVTVVPLPVVVTLPGLRVNVHVPDDGNPLSATDPVATVQVGWVMVPAIGAEGIAGCAFITTVPDVDEVHPDAFVTL